MSILEGYKIPKKKMQFMAECAHVWGLPHKIYENIGQNIEDSTKTDKARAGFNDLYARIQRTAEDYCYNYVEKNRGRKPMKAEVGKEWKPLRNAGVVLDEDKLWSRMGRE